MNNKKKVIMFCEYFGNGGIEKILSYINENLNKEKYSTQIICTIKNTQIYEEDIKSISKFKIRNPIYRFIKTILNIKKVTADADIVHFNIHSPIGLLYAFLIRNTKAKIIIHAHNSNFDNDFLKIKTFIAFIIKKLFLSSKYTYIACSESAALFCFNKKTKYTILKNEIDCEKFIYDEGKRKELRKEYKIGANEIIIGNIGRIEKQKNHEFLIEVFDAFLKKQSNAKLFLVGAGKQEKKIRNLINKKKINDKVIIMNFYSDIQDLYQIFDFYLVTSRYEGYGMTVYEALNSSLLCFVSDKITQNFSTNENIIPISLNKTPEEWASKIEEYIGYKREKKLNLSSNNYIKELEKIYN